MGEKERMDLKSKLRQIPDFPKEGVNFIDITTVLQDPDAFRQSVDEMAELVSDLEYDLIIGSESRGFIMGAPLAYASGSGFIPVRKSGKLPYLTIETSYQLEYGVDRLEMHTDAIKEGQRVLIVDDLLATGGTAKANCDLVEKLGGEVVGLLFFIELTELEGRSKLDGYRIESIVQF